MIGIVGRNDHPNDRSKFLLTKIGAAVAEICTDFFQPFLRGFVTVQRLLPEVNNEGFFSRHLARPEAVLDRNHAVEDPCIGQATALALRPTSRVAAHAGPIARRSRWILAADDVVPLSHGQESPKAISPPRSRVPIPGCCVCPHSTVPRSFDASGPPPPPAFETQTPVSAITCVRIRLP